MASLPPWSGATGELETGEASLSLATHELADTNLPGVHIRADEPVVLQAMGISLVTRDVASAHARALREGAIELSAPVTKPWGQVVSYVRALDGYLIELCSPVGE